MGGGRERDFRRGKWRHELLHRGREAQGVSAAAGPVPTNARSGGYTCAANATMLQASIPWNSLGTAAAALGCFGVLSWVCLLSSTPVNLL